MQASYCLFLTTSDGDSICYRLDKHEEFLRVRIGVYSKGGCPKVEIEEFIVLVPASKNV